ncbi:hypothetical protein NUW58_g5317 [Xylaria curta]|uniref:Uncharacterized protein n=1 Tax=Xylaria curta TaxID=42375 RepID=A0ACC1P4L6_9PEZI|nr:hypothetical protein NUW58_g5317 [Xylaria curta]
MDPVTIVQVVGTVVSLGDVVVRCIAGLSALKAQFHDAPLILTSMIGQLHMVKIAQSQLSPLNSSRFGHDPRYKHLAGQMGNALDGFGPILLALGQQLDRYEGISADGMTAKRRMGFLQGEREMTNLSILLDRQVNALNLLLQAIQCQTWIQQSDKISQSESQSILQLARDCSSSLVVLEDDALSFVSETTANISTIFEFDNALRSTALYQTAERSHLKQAIRAKKERGSGNTSDSPVRGRATFGFRQAFRGMKLSGPISAPNAIDTQKEIRVDIQLDVVVESPQKSVSAEEVSLREDLSHSNSGDTSAANPSTEAQGSSQSAPSGISFRKHQIQAEGSSLRRPPRKPTPDRNIQPKVAKVLLLGASGGGKTTLVNSLQLFTKSNRAKYNESYNRTLVWRSALDAAGAVLRAMEELDIDEEFTSQVREFLLEDYTAYDYDPALDPRHATKVAQIISCPRFSLGYQQATECSESFQFHENVEYFLNHIHRLAEQATRCSAPTDGDLLRTRFHLYDVGGERSERKKWIHAFKDVSAIIYPIDPTGYKRSLREDLDGNAMFEQFMLFESVLNSHWFVRSAFVVVFTKMDLLEGFLEKWDVNAFLRQTNIVDKLGPRVATAAEYLKHLEDYFRKFVRSPDVRGRVRFIRANLVDVDKYNTAIHVFDALESLGVGTGPSVFSGREFVTNDMDELRSLIDQVR